MPPPRPHRFDELFATHADMVLEFFGEGSGVTRLIDGQTASGRSIKESVALVVGVGDDDNGTPLAGGRHIDAPDQHRDRRLALAPQRRVLGAADKRHVARAGVIDPRNPAHGDVRRAESIPPFDMNRRPDWQARHAYYPSIGKPVIGMLNGATAGIGLVHALYCDLRFAADNTVFTTAFSRRGLIAEHGMQALMDGALMQLTELVAYGLLGAIAYTILKACERVLVDKMLR